MRQLTLGPRTRAQLQDVLLRRGVPEDVIVRVLDRFQDVALVDDQEFARNWVSSRHTGKGLARRALAHELRHRGVDEQLVRNAVNEISPEDELRTARDLVRRKLSGLAGTEPERRTRRLAGMLARKGYGPGVALEAIRIELGALTEGGVDPFVTSGGEDPNDGLDPDG